MLYLLFYFVLFVITLYVYWRKKQSIDSGFVLISLYALYSAFTLLLYNDPSSELPSFDIYFLPLVFLYLCLMISFLPVLSFNSSRFKGICPPSGNILGILVLTIILSYVFQIDAIINDFSQGLFLIMLDEQGGADLYAEAADNASSGGIGISNIFAILGNLFYNFGVLLFFYYLTHERKNKIILVGLILAMLIGMLSIISKGHRGGVVNHLLAIVGTYFLLKDFIIIKSKKLMKVVGIIAVIVVAIPFMALTSSRYSMREGGIESSFNNYGGQAVLFFDQYAFDNNGIRYGDRCAPMFKQALGFDNVPRNYMERRSKYPHLRINDEVFVTFVGDLCLDFGPLIAFFLIIIFSTITKRIIRHKGQYLPFYKLIPLHLAMTICIEGGSLASFADTGNLVLIIYALLYFFFYLEYHWETNSFKKNHNIPA